MTIKFTHHNQVNTEKEDCFLVDSFCRSNELFLHFCDAFASPSYILLSYYPYSTLSVLYQELLCLGFRLIQTPLQGQQTSYARTSTCEPCFTIWIRVPYVETRRASTLPFIFINKPLSLFMEYLSGKKRDVLAATRLSSLESGASHARLLSHCSNI